MKKSHLFVGLMLLGFMYTHDALALSPVNQAQYQDIRSAFMYLKTVQVPPIVVPTIVSVNTDLVNLSELNAAVFDDSTGAMVPFVLEKNVPSTTPISATYTQLGATADAPMLVDRNPGTVFGIYPNTAGQDSITITVRGAAAFTASSFVLYPERNASLPNRIQIEAIVDGVERVLVAESAVRGSTIFFPQTRSGEWNITLWYTQPLILHGVDIPQENLAPNTPQSVRFLAQPNTRYTLYVDPERQVSRPFVETGNLFATAPILAASGGLGANPLYRPADTDRDGVPDQGDNCPNITNQDQRDVDRNGTGDACDDFDYDGVVQSIDNCPDWPNVRQDDRDGDGMGDVCDPEDNRVTEKYPWVPWAGMGIAALVILVLFALVARSPKVAPPEARSE